VITAVNGDLAYAGGWDGTGIGIAVIDSGVGSAYDLNTDDNQSSRIAYNESFVPGDFSNADAFGHGTHISGIIAGNAYSSSTSSYPGVYRGIAPESIPQRRSRHWNRGCGDLAWSALHINNTNEAATFQ